MKAAALIVLAVLIGLYVFGPQLPAHAPVQPKPPTAADIELMKRREAVAFLTIKDFSWGTGGFGTVMTANFVFNNPSDYDVKDIVVRCEHTAASGTTIDSNTKTIFERVPARSTKAIRNFNMGFIHSQASRSACSVVTAVPGDYRAPPAAKSPPKPGAAATASKP